MGFSFVYASTIIGLRAEPVRVETDITNGLPKFQIVGLPDAAVSESKERVRSALKNSGLPFPRTIITINLAPADVRKQGPVYDLAIAMSILSAAHEITDDERLRNTVFLGELALDGAIRPVRGVLLSALMAKAQGYSSMVVASENAPEAALVAGLTVHPAKNLLAVVQDFMGQDKLPVQPPTPISAEHAYLEDMEHVRGQEHVKRALEIAAAGGHNVLLFGSPGSGKTMLARALPSLLPALTFAEMLETTAIHSVAGVLRPGEALIKRRPFRTPHHSASGVALVGGGAWAKPGEISLAHGGILFLDEFPEFSRQVLENLRQPLEDGVVTVSRASGTFTYPARFMLVAAMNPCPCGYLFDNYKKCLCSPLLVNRYQQKISGPLLDRLDIVTEVKRVEIEKLVGTMATESSATIRARVQAARTRQQERYAGLPLTTNADLTAPLLRTYCELAPECLALMKTAVDKLQLSARAYGRVLKVARTIADLAGDSQLSAQHLAEALQYRSKGLARS